MLLFNKLFYYLCVNTTHESYFFEIFEIVSVYLLTPDCIQAKWSELVFNFINDKNNN